MDKLQPRPASAELAVYWRKVREVGQAKEQSKKRNCERCGDTGWLDFANEIGQEPVLLPAGTSNLYFYDHPRALHVTEVCECRKQQVIQSRIESILDGSAGVPEEYQDRTFETWDAMPESWRRDKGEARRIAEAFAMVKYATGEKPDRKKYGLVLAGLNGRGKSSLAAAILRRRIERGQVGLWIDFRKYLRQTYTTMRKNAQWDREEIVGVAAEAPFLVWDDFADAAQRDEISDFVRNAIGDVIAERHARHLPTCITTNLDDTAIYEQFDDKIGDRVLQMCHWQDVGGENMRFSQKFKSD
jgi:DNA replication protein DnaC